MTHQTLSLEKYWKLFPATLKLFLIKETIGNEVKKQQNKKKGEIDENNSQRESTNVMSVPMRGASQNV